MDDPVVIAPLVERLRERQCGPFKPSNLHNEAVDRIEALEHECTASMAEIDNLRRDLAEARSRAIEECAKIAEDHETMSGDIIADAIRALTQAIDVEGG